MPEQEKTATINLETPTPEQLEKAREMLEKAGLLHRAQTQPKAPCKMILEFDRDGDKLNLKLDGEQLHMFEQAGFAHPPIWARIVEPPCARWECECFKPVFQIQEPTESGKKYNRRVVVLCTNPGEMQRDFRCFRNRHFPGGITDDMLLTPRG